LKELTLIIPAKNESESLPLVLKELKKYKLKIIIILSSNDLETINSVKKFNCKVIKIFNDSYGNAIRRGIHCCKTKYLCIFNADGSFDPRDLNKMLFTLVSNNSNFVFASRYKGLNSGSKDDTFLTFIGNKIFTFICNFLFSLNLSDVLFTYVIGETTFFKKLKLKSSNFSICVEIPIKIKMLHYKMLSIPSLERKRLLGEKKVREFKDGFTILIYIIKLFFKKYIVGRV
jgi:glycosyltransferase involved in cell wall biosynthesis